MFFKFSSKFTEIILLKKNSNQNTLIFAFEKYKFLQDCTIYVFQTLYCDDGCFFWEKSNLCFEFPKCSDHLCTHWKTSCRRHIFSDLKLPDWTSPFLTPRSFPAAAHVVMGAAILLFFVFFKPARLKNIIYYWAGLFLRGQDIFCNNGGG